MTEAERYAVLFVIAWPIVTYAAWFAIRLAIADRTGVSIALALVTTGAAIAGSFLGAASIAFLVHDVEGGRILGPTILPSFLALEVMAIIVPLYLRTRRG